MRLQKRRMLGLAVFGLGTALITAGCGAGQITQTSTQQPDVNGAYAQVGKVAIRDAAVVNRDSCEQAYPQGASVPLKLWMINQGTRDDLLVSVTSDITSGAVVDGDKTVVAGRTLAIGPISSSPADSSGQSAQTSAGAATSASSATSSASTTAGTAQSAPSSPAVSPDQLGQGSVVLPGLTRAVWPGQTVKVTFLFRDAGPVSVELPVAAPTKPLKCEAS